MGLFGKGGLLSDAAPFLVALNAGVNPESNLAPAYLKMRQERDEQEAEAAAAAKIRDALLSEGLPENVVTGLMADPKRASEYFLSKYQTRQGGAEGFTVGGIGPDGKLRTQTSAGWHDGSYFGGTDGTEAPPVIREGLKFVPTPPGGQTQVFRGVTGRPVTRGEVFGGQQAGGPTLGTVVDGYRFRGGDPNNEGNWEPVQGGAGRSGPPMFPGPY